MFWLSGPRECEILAQGWNPHTPLHWRAKSQPLDHQEVSPWSSHQFRASQIRAAPPALISPEHLPPKACSLLSSPNSLRAELNLRPLRPSYLLSGWPQTLPSLSFLFPLLSICRLSDLSTHHHGSQAFCLSPPRAKPPSLTALLAAAAVPSGSPHSPADFWCPH